MFKIFENNKVAVFIVVLAFVLAIAFFLNQSTTSTNEIQAETKDSTPTETTPTETTPTETTSSNKRSLAQEPAAATTSTTSAEPALAASVSTQATQAAPATPAASAKTGPPPDTSLLIIQPPVSPAAPAKTGPPPDTSLLIIQPPVSPPTTIIQAATPVITTDEIDKNIWQFFNSSYCSSGEYASIITIPKNKTKTKIQDIQDILNNVINNPSYIAVYIYDGEQTAPDTWSISYISTEQKNTVTQLYSRYGSMDPFEPNNRYIYVNIERATKEGVYNFKTY
jgi:hypothetical protein